MFFFSYFNSKKTGQWSDPRISGRIPLSFIFLFKSFVHLALYKYLGNGFVPMPISGIGLKWESGESPVQSRCCEFQCKCKYSQKNDAELPHPKFP